MILLSKKLFQKLFYIALTNSCVNKDLWKNHVAFKVSLKVNRWEVGSVQTEVSKYELATNLAIRGSDSDLDVDDIICDIGNAFE